jgi:hypothetical protein
MLTFVRRCCIDKSSSAQLTESINSMFKWYRSADVCYAYLDDVPSASCKSQEAKEDKIRNSRWFTRGWTLQELLAPREVLFYSQDWDLLGSRTEFADLISSVTRIQRRFLGTQDLNLASIAQKMSWAATRRTTRLEDQAYSLLGIVDVNMPLIYGEGSKAFQRLQETLIKVYPEDLSVFAWGNAVVGMPSDVSPEVARSTAPIPWKPPPANPILTGLLAPSPDDFAKSGNIIPCRSIIENFSRYSTRANGTPSVTGSGAVRMRLPEHCRIDAIFSWADPPISQVKPVFVHLLLCNKDGREESSGGFAICATRTGSGVFSRMSDLVYIPDPINCTAIFANALRQTATPVFARQPKFAFCDWDIVFRRLDVRCGEAESKSTSIGDGMSHAYNYGARVLRLGNREGQLCSMNYRLKKNGSPTREDKGFAIRLERGSFLLDAGPIKACLIPYHFTSGKQGIEAKVDGVKLKWYREPMESAVPLRDSGHLMVASGYSWTVKERPFPVVFINVERIQLTTGGFIDAVDIVVAPKGPGEAHVASPTVSGSSHGEKVLQWLLRKRSARN